MGTPIVTAPVQAVLMMLAGWLNRQQQTVVEYQREETVRLARENDGWGYTKIRDVMMYLGHEIERTTVKRILDADGILPAPERLEHMPWAAFLKAHWGAIAAMDFFQVEVMTLRGPVRYAVLVVMDLESRRVQIAGVS